MPGKDDSTLGGYLAAHERPPAFEGSDGAPYSVATYVDDDAQPDGRFGGALLFVRWNSAGDAPAGHVETDYLVWGPTAESASSELRRLTLHEVKAALDQAIAAGRTAPW